MKTNLQLFRHFVVLADELHFGRAASRLHVVQPALTRSVKVLEESIGVKLLDRTSRHVSLTPAGAAFAARAREAIAQVDAAVNVAQRVEAGADEPLRIGVGAAAMYGVLPGLLSGLRKRHEGFDVSLGEGSPEQMVALLRSGHLDAAVVPREYVGGAGIQSMSLYRASLLAVVPETWELAQREHIHLAELNGLPYVSFPPTGSPPMYASLLSTCSRGGLVLRVRHTATGLNAMMSLVAAGMGFSLVNEGFRGVSVQGVVYLSVADEHAKGLLSFDIAWRVDNPSRSLRLLLDAAAESGLSASGEGALGKDTLG